MPLPFQVQNLLTLAFGLSATPVGGGGVAAGERGKALKLVTGQAEEEGLPSNIEAADCHLTIGWPLRQATA